MGRNFTPVISLVNKENPESAIGSAVAHFAGSSPPFLSVLGLGAPTLCFRLLRKLPVSLLALVGGYTFG